jgi:hypothetical protein
MVVPGQTLTLPPVESRRTTVSALAVTEESADELSPEDNARHGRRGERRGFRFGGTLSQVHDQAVAGGVPGEGSRLQKVDDDAGYIRLKLVGSQRGDLIGLHTDFFLRDIKARIGQVDHQPIWIHDCLDGRNERLGRKKLDCLTIFLLDDAEAFDGVAGEDCECSGNAQSRSVAAAATIRACKSCCNWQRNGAGRNV